MQVLLWLVMQLHLLASARVGAPRLLLLRLRLRGKMDSVSAGGEHLVLQQLLVGACSVHLLEGSELLGVLVHGLGLDLA